MEKCSMASICEGKWRLRIIQTVSYACCDRAKTPGLEAVVLSAQITTPLVLRQFTNSTDRLSTITTSGGTTLSSRVSLDHSFREAITKIIARRLVIMGLIINSMVATLDQGFPCQPKTGLTLSITTRETSRRERIVPARFVCE